MGSLVEAAWLANSLVPSICLLFADIGHRKKVDLTKRPGHGSRSSRKHQSFSK
jgi:hypothetical protein